MTYIWAFEWYEIFWPQITFEGQRSRSNPKNFEVEYLEKTVRDREILSIEVK